MKKPKTKIVVTLGNAALRILRLLMENEPSQRLPRTLIADSSKYGKTFKVKLKNGKTMQWYPLAHPAAPSSYKRVHKEWISAPH